MRLIDADALIEFCAERWIPLNIDAVNMQPTIQPEKAQLSQEGTTSDLISKTEIVEHLRRMLEATVPNTDYDEGFVDGVEFGVSTVSTMPTIQPEQTDEQVIDYCKKKGYKIVADDLFNLLKPEPQWIPVSERLPEKGGEYLVSVHHTIGAISVFHPEKDTYVDDVAIMKYYGKFPSTVRAWMPLPEAYKPNK